jgi:hypothetical protein
LYASGLITASHTDGITTTKLHSVGAITTQSTISASGLITASHTDGITTTKLYASGLITASNGISVQTITAVNTGTDVNLFTGQTAGVITIGTANSTVTVTSPLTTTGALNAQQGIVLSASKFITVSAPASNPGSTQIGYSYKALDISGSTALGTSFANLSSSSNFQLSAGTWLAELSGSFSNNAGFGQIGLSSTSGVIDTARTASTYSVNSGTIGAYIKMTTIIQQIGTVTWYVVVYRGTVAVSVGTIVVNETRIA